MRYINFEIAGERLRPKLLRYCSSRFPDFPIYGNDTFSGFRFRDHGGERHIVILFNSMESGKKAIINLGLAEYHWNLPMDKALDKLFLNSEYEKLAEWAHRWELVISNQQLGVKPEFTIDSIK